MFMMYTNTRPIQSRHFHSSSFLGVESYCCRCQFLFLFLLLFFFFIFIIPLWSSPPHILILIVLFLEGLFHYHSHYQSRYGRRCLACLLFSFRVNRGILNMYETKPTSAANEMITSKTKQS